LILFPTGGGKNDDQRTNLIIKRSYHPGDVAAGGEGRFPSKARGGERELLHLGRTSPKGSLRKSLSRIVSGSTKEEEGFWKEKKRVHP